MLILLNIYSRECLKGVSKIGTHVSVANPQEIGNDIMCTVAGVQSFGPENGPVESALNFESPGSCISLHE